MEIYSSPSAGVSERNKTLRRVNNKGRKMKHYPLYPCRKNQQISIHLSFYLLQYSHYPHPRHQQRRQHATSTTTTKHDENTLFACGRQVIFEETEKEEEKDPSHHAPDDYQFYIRSFLDVMMEMFYGEKARREWRCDWIGKVDGR